MSHHGTHKSVVPNPPIYCLYQHILYVTCHSPFIAGLKAIMYNTAKSVAARAFSLLNSAYVALRKISRPLPSLQLGHRALRLSRYGHLVSALRDVWYSPSSFGMPSWSSVHGAAAHGPHSVWCP